LIFPHSIVGWNKMLLSLGGYLARSVYESKLGRIKSRDYFGGIDHGLMRKEALHLLRSFAFVPPEVPQKSDTVSYFSRAFFIEGGPFFVLTRNGFHWQKASQFIRIPPEMQFLGLFLKFPENVVLDNDISDIIGAALAEHGIVRDISIEFFKSHIKRRLLTDTEVEVLLLWLYRNNAEGKVSEHTCRDLITVIHRVATGRPLCECHFYSTFNDCETFGRSDVFPRNLEKQISLKFLQEICSLHPFEPSTWLEKVQDEGSWDSFWRSVGNAQRSFSDNPINRFREVIPTAHSQDPSLLLSLVSPSLATADPDLELPGTKPILAISDSKDQIMQKRYADLLKREQDVLRREADVARRERRLRMREKQVRFQEVSREGSTVPLDETKAVPQVGQDISQLVEVTSELTSTVTSHFATKRVRRSRFVCHLFPDSIFFSRLIPAHSRPPPWHQMRDEMPASSGPLCHPSALWRSPASLHPTQSRALLSPLRFASSLSVIIVKSNYIHLSDTGNNGLTWTHSDLSAGIVFLGQSSAV
jgi:hypothetical protein